MNRPIFLIGDVYSGFEVLKISGASQSQIRQELTSPRWRFVEEGSPDSPQWLESRSADIHNTEWGNKSEYLKNLIFLDRMAREGKSSYSVKGKLKDGTFQHRFVYAKSAFQLLWRYPRLGLYYYGPIYGWATIGYSDVDIEDEYLRQFKWRRT